HPGRRARRGRAAFARRREDSLSGSRHVPPRMIDAHHHLYDLERHTYTWLQAEPVPEIFEGFLGDIGEVRKTYGVDRYLADVAAGNVVKSVCLEVGWAGELADETAYLQSLADEHGFPHAIVGGAEL